MIGTHISLKNDILTSLKEYYNNTIKEPDYSIPFQIFSGSPKMFKRKKMNNIKETANFISINNITGFIHSPYVINLSNMKDDSFNCILYELDLANKTNIKGTVVHVGKHVNDTKEIGLNNMKNNIDSIFSEYSNNSDTSDLIKNAKLILETPAGQGTELLTNINDFILFCKQYSDNPNFGICVDTCHVFASGHDPLEYLIRLKEEGLYIDLVHLNDSKDTKGSRKDRHEEIGKGHIGLEKMNEIINYCNKEKIPMIIE